MVFNIALNLDSDVDRRAGTYAKSYVDWNCNDVRIASIFKKDGKIPRAAKRTIWSFLMYDLSFYCMRPRQIIFHRIGLIGGVGVWIFRRYGLATVFNTFGALYIAESMFDL